MQTTNIQYTAIVIGAGSGGLTVALGLASAGKKVLMVEKGLIGGDCTNYGCVPSKALIHAEGSIVQSLEATRKIRDGFRHEETAEMFAKKYPSLTIVAGEARLMDIHTVTVGKKQFTAESIVIATGSDPRLGTIEWVPTENILSNREIFDVADLKNLVVVGWGFIGIELALAFARRNVHVTMLVRGDRLGTGEHDEFTEALHDTLVEAGVTILFETTALRGSASELTVTSHNRESTLTYDKILMAVGRVVDTEGLELEKIGIKTDKNSAIITDKYGRTNIKNIFAIGDVVSGNRQFTHLANHEGRGVIQTILFPFLKKKIKGAVIPSTLYDSKYEFARTGLTETEAADSYGKHAIRVEMLPFTSNDRSKTEERVWGYVKIIAHRLTLQVIGAEIVGPHAGEMISVLTLALQEKISLYRLKEMIVPYPTRSDLVKRVADKIVISTLQNIKGDLKWYIAKRIPLIVGSCVWLSIIGIFVYFKSVTGKDNLAIMKDIYALITQSAWGPLIYIVFYAFRPLIFFPATLLTFLSGVLFGVWGGFAYTMIGENMSASVAYLTGRFFGKNIPELKKSPIELDSDKAFSSILFTRLAFFPFDIVNYLAGFLRIPWIPFALATLIGIIPGALVFIIAGASVRVAGGDVFDLSMVKLDPRLLIVSGALFVVSFAFAKYLNKWQQRKKSEKEKPKKMIK